MSSKKLPGVLTRLEAAAAAFSHAGPALIGVSGGRDSVALLHALVKGGARELVVCHLDHGLRRGSAADVQFVKELAAQHGLSVDVGNENVCSLAERMGVSVETAAREARYGFFARVARERGIHRLLLAHHADDQVETLLFRLFRGAGPGGLRGMQTETTRVVDGVELHIARPLLGVWREEIDAYLAHHGLAFCEDPSNADPRHTRNRIRHELLPLLSEVFGRDVRRSVWRAAEILRAEDDLLSGQVPAPESELSVVELHEMPEAMQRRTVHRWLVENGIGNVGFTEVESVRSLLTGRRARINLPGNRCARRRAKKLFLANA